MRSLIVGGIEIPIRASHVLSQSYTPVQATTRLRMANGALKQQTSWSNKSTTEISADGVIPAGLQLLDYSQSIIIKCVAERAVSSASNVITVPSARRSDYGIEGRAMVGNNLVKTPVSLVGNVATLTAVTDATLYQAIYWPELACFCDPPSESRGVRSMNYGWSLTGEEI